MSYRYGSNPDPYPYPDGTLIRYDSGSTALGMTNSLHASGYHINHCMGGMIYVQHCNIHKASDADFKKWVECEKWRKP